MKWFSNNGKEYDIRDMDTGHIQNCIIKINEKIEACQQLNIGTFVYHGMYGYTWIYHFKQELIRRGVIRPELKKFIGETSFGYRW